MNQRPRDVWTASLMLMFFGALGVVLSLFLLNLLAGEDDIPGLVTAAMAGGLVLAALEIVSGAFVLAGREWARIAAICVCVLNGVSGLATLTAGLAPQACVGIVVNIALVVALSKEDVREWCRRERSVVV